VLLQALVLVDYKLFFPVASSGISPLTVVYTCYSSQTFRLYNENANWVRIYAYICF
jgi:hypothetical protein